MVTEIREADPPKLKTKSKSKYTYPHIYIDPETVLKMSEADEHSKLIAYFAALLEWVFKDKEDWYLLDDIKMMHRAKGIIQDIGLDIAIVEGITKPITGPNERLISWHIGQPNRPAPFIVFEVASRNTWKNDVGEQEGNKIEEYRLLGVREYFAYDPYFPPFWATDGKRLRGWRYIDGITHQLELDERGWMESVELDGWLVPDGKMLRLYDREGRQRLTEGEDKSAALKLAEYNIREAKRQTSDAKRQAREAERLATAAERKLEAERIEAAQKFEAEQAARQDLERRLAALEAKFAEINRQPNTDD